MQELADTDPTFGALYGAVDTGWTAKRRRKRKRRRRRRKRDTNDVRLSDYESSKA